MVDISAFLSGSPLYEGRGSLIYSCVKVFPGRAGVRLAGAWPRPLRGKSICRVKQTTIVTTKSAN